MRLSRKRRGLWIREIALFCEDRISETRGQHGRGISGIEDWVD
jgi:hypothetical protein